MSGPKGRLAAWCCSWDERRLCDDLTHSVRMWRGCMCLCVCYNVYACDRRLNAWHRPHHSGPISGVLFKLARYLYYIHTITHTWRGASAFAFNLTMRGACDSAHSPRTRIRTHVGLGIAGGLLRVRVVYTQHSVA